MHHNDVFSGVKCTKGGAGGELTGYYGGAKGSAAAIKFSKDNPGLGLQVVGDEIKGSFESAASKIGNLFS